MVVLEGKLGEEICFFGLILFFRYGDSFSFIVMFLVRKESVVKERLEFYKCILFSIGFVVLLDK